MSSLRARIHKEYKQSVKEQLKIPSLGIPAFLMDIYLELIDFDPSWANSMLRFRYSNRGASARVSGNMLRSLLATIRQIPLSRLITDLEENVKIRISYSLPKMELRSVFMDFI